MKTSATFSMMLGLMFALSVPAMAAQPEEPPCEKLPGCGPGNDGNGAVIGKNGVTVFTGSGDTITINRATDAKPPVLINGCEPGTEEICEAIP